MTGERLRLDLRTPLADPELSARGGSERDDFDGRAALRAFEKAVRLSPSDPDYHFVLGEALLRDGQHTDALAAFEEAVRLHPDDATYHIAVAEALFRLGRWEEAARAARRACDASPGDADAWSALGAAQAQVPLEGAARAALTRALELDPGRADTRNNLGVLLWRSGAREDAVAELRVAARRRPEAAWVQLNLGRMLVASGSEREGESALVRAQLLAPRDPEPVVDLADLRYAAGSWREAARDYERALALAPTCLESRPKSREAYRALLQDAVRRELREGRRGRWAADIGSLLRRGSAWLIERLASTRGAALFALSLAILATLGHVTWQIGGPWVRHFLFRDAVVAVARAPVADDDEVRERLRLAIRQNGLTEAVVDRDCAIDTREHTRTITCRYDVTLTLVPGRPRTLSLGFRVEEPYLAPNKTLFY